LNHGLIETLRGDLRRMLDALRVPARDPACSDWHPPEDSSFVFCSPMRGRVDRMERDALRSLGLAHVVAQLLRNTVYVV
jgi:hypothetical protein